jgi:16S rRNA (uracil1498-N3)-methyltransferase
MPKLNEEIAFLEFIKNDTSARKLIASCEEGNKQKIKDIYHPFESVTVLIGPEGDFCEAEITKAKSCGYELITLGSTRLRTETAALVALQSINFINY